MKDVDLEQTEDDTVIARGSDVYSLGQHMGKKRVFDTVSDKNGLIQIWQKFNLSFTTVCS